jgi:superfamily II DNA/RNA helicase
VGRTGRAEATGDAFTFVSPQEEADLRRIEQAIGKKLPRITVPGFDLAPAAPVHVRRSPRRRGSYGGQRRARH